MHNIYQAPEHCEMSGVYCYMLLVCHALQAVPRGPRDGEPMNMRRATVAHETGNECPNR